MANKLMGFTGSPLTNKEAMVLKNAFAGQPLSIPTLKQINTDYVNHLPDALIATTKADYLYTLRDII